MTIHFTMRSAVLAATWYVACTTAALYWLVLRAEARGEVLGRMAACTPLPPGARA